jgi:hypothetical protein
MANPEVTAFADTTATTGAIALREADVPDASFTDGVNWGGSCSPGLGINIDGGAVEGSNEQFTLLDQFEAVRVPQDASYIGNSGLGDGLEGVGLVPITTATIPDGPDESGDITATITGDANLQTLAAGWVNTAI